MNTSLTPLHKYQTIVEYCPPVRHGTIQSDGGLKKRVCLVNPEHDKIGKYLVAGENISAGGIWAWIKEKCLSRWYFCVIIDQQKICLNTRSALARLELSEEELRTAQEMDNIHHNHNAISQLVQTKLSKLDQELQVHPQPTFDVSCIRHLPLNKVAFLGSHNACLTEEEGWNYNQQHWSLLKQLNRGVRVIELDIAADNKGILQICHGTAHTIDPLKKGRYQTCKEKLVQLKNWLEANPNEVLIVKLDNGRDTRSQMNAIDRVIEEVSLEELMYTPADLMKRDEEMNDHGWPTVGEMIASGKRLIMTNAKLNEKEESAYTHFAGNVLEEVALDTYPPKFKSRTVPNQTSIYSPRTHKLRFMNYSTEISNQTLVNFLKTASPLLTCFKPLISLFTNKLNIPKITKDLLDGSPKAVDQVAERLAEKCNGRPMVPLMDFVEEYIAEDGLEIINQRNLSTITENQKE